MKTPTLTDDDMENLSLWMAGIEDVLARAFAPHDMLDEGREPIGEVVEPAVAADALTELSRRLEYASGRARRWAREAGA